ncbi:SAM-dependent methyltransferase [Streptomyces phage KimJongPhill]|uniref:Methyltransferase n=1 Tax=Streptomyces phage KimJongPhill TaxID=2848886 RepID=A0A8F2E6M1_9CAUD|nr:SAM-dependent methyltransferase [Streptomyces phage KimJongPhill]QWT29889.1 methyltransferase [Streptomyces phage KimJongPhill]
MHPEARAGLDRMIDHVGIDRQYPYRCLDLGGRDINGGIRDLIPNGKWQGVDIEAGPGVDLVRDCTMGWLDTLPRFDIVVCTEVLEHVEKWRDILRTCAQALDTMGSQLLFVTAASTGRRAHGASGAMDPAPGEWYRNVPAEDVAEELGHLFNNSGAEYNPVPGDVYAWATLPRWGVVNGE